MHKSRTVLGAAAFMLAFTPIHASAQTTTSPTGGPLPAGVTAVGGLVVDLEGSNGNRVVSQLAASQMYRGFADFSENPVAGVAPGNPLLIGTQTGFSPAVISGLGGGLQSAAFRLTLFDGDSAPGDFDFNENTFLVNGVSIGNWSDVTTYHTNSTGTSVFSTSTGFGNNILSTGFFSLSDIGALADLFASLVSTSQLQFFLNDADPNDNFFDFTQGVDGGLIDVGTGPVVTPPNGAVPEPSTWAMLLIGFFGIGGALRSVAWRRRVPNSPSCA